MKIHGGKKHYPKKHRLPQNIRYQKTRNWGENLEKTIMGTLENQQKQNKQLIKTHQTYFFKKR